MWRQSYVIFSLNRLKVTMGCFTIMTKGYRYVNG
jgi:hypothetical protein